MRQGHGHAVDDDGRIVTGKAELVRRDMDATGLQFGHRRRARFFETGAAINEPIDEFGRQAESAGCRGCESAC